MSNQITGIVKFYDVKPLSNGNVLHSVNINGSKYSVFAKDSNPRANKGDTVEFKAAQNEKGYWNIQGPINVTKRAAGHQQGGRGSYAPNDDQRQNSIIRQNAMSQANTMVAALIGSGRYQSLSEDELAAEIIRLANDFFFPYAQEGKQPEHEGGGVSEYEGSQDPDESEPEF